MNHRDRLTITALILVIALPAVAATAVVSRKAEAPAINPPTLGDRVAAACKPGRVSDWHVDYQDESLLVVTCYDPKTTNIKTTVVER